LLPFQIEPFHCYVICRCPCCPCSLPVPLCYQAVALQALLGCIARLLLCCAVVHVVCCVLVSRCRPEVLLCCCNQFHCGDDIATALIVVPGRCAAGLFCCYVVLLFSYARC
jgi:hypothetical protein